MMLSFGKYVFAVNTTSYQQLQRTVGATWTATERLNTTPALHATGFPASTITLCGVIYPKTALELSAFSALRTQAQQLTPHWLVDGSGKVWGQWVITRLQETQTLFWSNGQPRQITFDVQLMQYNTTGLLPDNWQQAIT